MLPLSDSLLNWLLLSPLDHPDAQSGAFALLPAPVAIPVPNQVGLTAPAELYSNPSALLANCILVIVRSPLVARVTAGVSELFHLTPRLTL